MMNILNNDNICAIASAVGGAIAVIRVSGPEAIAITGKIFSKDISNAKSHTIHYGEITENGTIVDDVLISIFRAPHSYTGENSTEISCHGSRYIINQIIKLLIDNGCRQAAPGEYTQRAFMNGKMDLSQAEAVADLIASTNSATHKMAMSQLRGNFSSELSRLRDQLLHITSLLELELDFSDQDVNFADRQELLSLAETIQNHITTLAHSFATGKAIKSGIPVAIAGKTNVGKSTLLNVLVGEDKAIVSSIHGTTRDVIEDCTDINGITFRFIDTAGIRSTEDEIERIGIERTYKKIDEATIILWLIDTLPTSEELTEMESLCENKKLIIVNNKTDITDITPQLSSMTQAPIIGISAKQSTNIAALRDTIYTAADIPAIHENDIIVTSARHYESLQRANDSLTRVIDGLHSELSGDLISEDLKDCLHHLADILGGEGAITSQDVLNSIFSRFCIGK